MNNTKIEAYLAAPLFNHREREFNEWLATELAASLDVFLPQRDGSLLADMLAAGVEQNVAERRVYEQDCEAMRRASLLIAVLDGGYVDEGVAFEIGFVKAIGVYAVGLQTDVRRALPSGNNPMIAKGLDQIFYSTEGLINWVRQYAKSDHTQPHGGLRFA